MSGEHRALFQCPRWIYKRTEFESYVGMPLTVENLIKPVTRKQDEIGLGSKRFPGKLCKRDKCKRELWRAEEQKLVN